MLKPLLKFLRLPNLLIVGLTQYLLLYCLLMPFLDAGHVSPTLDHLHFFLFVLDTIIITLSGNIVNDIEDYEIDLINRPDTVFVSKFISIPNAWKLYWGVVTTGFLLALYLAFYIDKLPLVLIYPTAVAMLYFYSTSFKKLPVIGNFVVSIFCGGVAAIILFAEKDAYFQLDDITQNNAWLTFMAYAVFAFLTTMFREIVKDIEDMKGDAERGCKTLPIVIGKNKARIFALINGFALLPLLGFIAWKMYENNSHFILWLYPILFVFIPMLYLLISLQQASQKTDFHKISSLMKGIMLMGLIYLILFYSFG
jgi:4-hydroxybenzoate polyprenyltransferase